ncbi:myelin-oligodendrocyte glycoprotein-like [Channa argus]|uniref:myelin-oligodendrocyte glycoprotein-like n=1 Tax=Channa argus TaxID=215402 RepID=UPI003522579F
MNAVSSASFLSTLVLLRFSPVFASDVKSIIAKPGENVILPCQSHSNSIIRVAEWSRLDLTKYVFLYRGRNSDTANQDPSYKNRVEMKDKNMKDGDVSLILRNVSISDSGTYECRVELKETKRRKRSFLDTNPISTIHLKVVPSGGDEDGGDKDGNVGLKVGLSVVALLVGVVGVVMYRKRKRTQRGDFIQSC